MVLRSPNMKVKCPDCKEGFDISLNDYEEDDPVQCPECSIDLVIKVKEGKFKLMTEKEQYYDAELEEELFEDAAEE